MREGGIPWRDNPRECRAGKIPAGVGIRNKVDLVDCRRRTESRVELRQREQHFVTVSPRGDDVLVQDIGVTRIDQG
jgi:hypothetical protein